MRKKLIERNMPPEWNCRVLTEDDLITFCDQLNVDIIDGPLEQPGCRIPYRGRTQLYLNNRLRGHDRLYVGFHEWGHCAIHPPRIQFFCGLNRSIEFEADAIAACALIPRPLITHYWPEEIAEEYLYPDWMIKFRQTLLKYWEI